MITIRVHDGRAGRDPQLVDPATNRGQLLLTFSSPRPYNLEDRLWLPDGTVVEVIGVSESWRPDSTEQDLSVGDVFDV